MRLNRFSVFNIGKTASPFDYFDHHLNEKIFRKVANKCYLPTNKLLLDLIDQYDKKFRISYSLTGTFIEYCQKHREHFLRTAKHRSIVGIAHINFNNFRTKQ